MDKELYFGVDVSKKTLDLAYYDGETIDWKNAHIQVSNDDAGFKKIGSWVAKVGKDFDTFLYCMEYTGLYNQNFRLWLESKEYIYSMVNPSINDVIEPEASVQPMIDRYSRMEEVLAWKMPGAGGGGYLALVVKDSLKFAENHDEAIHLQIRRA